MNTYPSTQYPYIYRFPERRTGLHFPDLLGLRAREKLLLSVVSVLRVIFEILHSSAKTLRTYRVVVRMFSKYFILLDPQILSGLHNLLNIHQHPHTF